MNDKAAMGKHSAAQRRDKPSFFEPLLWEQQHGGSI
jgi:hypothetical protein